MKKYTRKRGTSVRIVAKNKKRPTVKINDRENHEILVEIQIKIHTEKEGKYLSG